MPKRPEKGLPKKGERYGGRKKGSPNKVTAEARELIRQAIDLQTFKKRLNRVKSDAQYCAIVLKLMEFVLPKMKSIEISGDQDKPVILELPSRLTVEDIKAVLEEDLGEES